MSYFWNKLLFSASVFLGVYTIIFFLFQILSIDSVLGMIGQSTDSNTEKAIAKQFHLDLPAWKRFAIHLNDLVPLSVHSESPSSPIYFDRENYRGDKLISIGLYGLYLKNIYLGRSFQNHELVSILLWDRFKITLLLTLLSISIASILGIALGIIASVYHHKFIDNAILAFSSLGISAPSFFVAILLALVFGYYLSDYTGLNFKGSLIEYDDMGEPYYEFKNLILPILALSWRPIAMITQLTRNSMLEVLREDYIRTAIAKGLSRNVIFWKHALVNALNPVLTSISSWFGSLLAGAYFIEVIFDIKGLGALTVNALMKFDTPVIIGASLYISLTFILISFAVDYAYRLLDPRIK